MSKSIMPGGTANMIIYNKLVRDRIPEIIGRSGRKAESKVLVAAEYQQCLDEKLTEELQEYLTSGNIEELADLQEVIYAIVEHRGMKLRDFEKVRLEKREERGGFTKRLFLLGVTEGES
jgi:predicted house-cleaning noncanonical NTP pyrophosphatase (MazG superfamily)